MHVSVSACGLQKEAMSYWANDLGVLPFITTVKYGVTMFFMESSK
jgi:hypothetical protein